MSENGEIYTAGKNFTLPPALTGWTNSTSVSTYCHETCQQVNLEQSTMAIEYNYRQKLTSVERKKLQCCVYLYMSHKTLHGIVNCDYTPWLIAKDNR